MKSCVRSALGSRKRRSVIGGIAALVLAFTLSATLGSAAPTPPATPYLDAVASQLRTRAPGTEDKIWWFARGNALAPGWFLPTPDCWGQLKCSEPPPGGARILDRITGLIADAQVSVDIADLYPPPSGQFEQAIVDGLKEGHRDHPNRVPQVRILVGEYPFSGAGVHTQDQYAKGLEQKLGFTVPLVVGYMMTTVTSWNHEKVIDADGRTAIVGGMNYWAPDYLNTAEPINDVSMQVTGPAAVDVDRFTDIMWRWTCTHAGNGSGFALQGGSTCVQNLPTAPVPPYSPGVPMIVVGHLGNGIDVPGEADKKSPPITHPLGIPFELLANMCGPTQRFSNNVNNSESYEYRNPGEDALRALVASAKKSIFISQQDLMSCLPRPEIATEARFDERLFAELGHKIVQGVPIQIVLSDGTGRTSGPASFGTYRNGPFSSLQEVARDLTVAVSRQPGVVAPQARTRVCRDVLLATIRNGPGAGWNSGNRFANHAKLVEVDDQAFYIGSENLYPSRLQELGLIVEDPAAVATLRSSYIDPIVRWSRPDALIDPSTGKCGSF